MTWAGATEEENKEEVDRKHDQVGDQADVELFLGEKWASIIK